MTQAVDSERFLGATVDGTKPEIDFQLQKTVTFYIGHAEASLALSLYLNIHTVPIDKMLSAKKERNKGTSQTEKELLLLIIQI
jgi:hypothetical protein